MNPDQIIANVLDVYALARSYRDCGSVVTRWHYPAGETTRGDRVQEFRTAFVRPDRVRFETWQARAEHSRFGRAVVAAHGTEYRRWRDTRPGVETFDSLWRALLPVLGLSAGADAALALLIPDARYNGLLANLTDLAQLPTDELHRRACYRLRARCSWWNDEPEPEDAVTLAEAQQELERIAGRAIPSGGTRNLPLTLWVDSHTFVVRRIECRQLEAHRATEVITTHLPEVNATIGEAELDSERLSDEMP